ncbi:hypothetical protein HOP61_13270 [Halomonas daqingensis]|uniref:Minor tail T domain-containing protein n=1 Tax=Billgrantia desiderata TaxID=52021 RepID=A0AAW4YVW9_9GAMM|nr:hypothetical protein [Halomonas desiderata]
MLAGVGGKTIAEAKENLTTEEYYQWCEYRAITGPLVGSTRIEHHLAQLALIQARIGGDKNSKLVDFMLYEADWDSVGQPQEIVATNPTEVFALLQSIAKK